MILEELLDFELEVVKEFLHLLSLVYIQVNFVDKLVGKESN